MGGEETLGDVRRLGRVVDHHRDHEHSAFGHVPEPVNGASPLAAEVSLHATLGRCRDHGYKKAATGDALADLAVVVVAGCQSIHVEPDGEACGVESRLQFLHGAEVLTCVADEDCAVGHLALRRQEAQRARRDARAGLRTPRLPAPPELGDEGARIAGAENLRAAADLL